MKPGDIVELVGKVTVRAPFGTIGYRARKKESTVAWALILTQVPASGQHVRDVLKNALADVEKRIAEEKAST